MVRGERKRSSARHSGLEEVGAVLFACAAALPSWPSGGATKARTPFWRRGLGLEQAAALAIGEPLGATGSFSGTSGCARARFRFFLVDMVQ